MEGSRVVDKKAAGIGSDGATGTDASSMSVSAAPTGLTGVHVARDQTMQTDSKAAATVKTNGDNRQNALDVLANACSSMPKVKESQSTDVDRTITVLAPPGKLGIVLNKNDGGMVKITKVEESSVLSGKVMLGDRIVAIDGEDVGNSTAEDIAALLTSKSESMRVLAMLPTEAAKVTTVSSNLKKAPSAKSNHHEVSNKKSIRLEVYKAFRAYQKDSKDEKLKVLSSALSRLPRWDRLLLIPLRPPNGKKVYDKHVLANRNGIEGLSANDDAVVSTFHLAMAQSSWKSGARMAIIEAERSDIANLELQDEEEEEEFWFGGYHDRRDLKPDFSVYEVKNALGLGGEYGDLQSKMEMFLKRQGSKHVDFSTVFGKNDGMILAPSDKRDEYSTHSKIWGTRMDDVDDDNNESVYQSIGSYNASFLVVMDWLSTMDFELARVDPFSPRMRTIICWITEGKRYAWLDRYISILKEVRIHKKVMEVSAENCGRLIQMIIGRKDDNPYVIDNERVAKHVPVLLGALSTKLRVKDIPFCDIFADVVAVASDRNNALKLVMRLVEHGLAPFYGQVNGENAIKIFLAKADLSLKLKRFDKKSIVLLLESMQRRNAMLRFESKHHKKGRESFVKLVGATLDQMISTHGLEVMKSTLIDAMMLLRRLNKSSVSFWATNELIQRLRLLAALPDDRVLVLKEHISETISDFVNKINSPDIDGNRVISILSQPGSTDALSFLLKHASKKQLARLALVSTQTIGTFDHQFLPLIKELSAKETGLPRKVLVECIVLEGSDGWGEDCKAPHIRRFLDVFPGLVAERDGINRLPIHLAIENGSGRKFLMGYLHQNLIQLVETFPESLTMSDPVSNLLPFMLAGSKGELDSTYELLRADPSVIDLAD